MNISNSINISFKLVDKFIRNETFDFNTINIFGLEKYIDNYNETPKVDKWQLISNTNTRYNCGSYVSPFGLETSIFIRYDYFDQYGEYKKSINVYTNLNNHFLIMQNTKEWLIWSKINFPYFESKRYISVQFKDK